jgi:hypothetical protein
MKASEAYTSPSAFDLGAASFRSSLFAIPSGQHLGTCLGKVIVPFATDVDLRPAAANIAFFSAGVNRRSLSETSAA